MERFSLKAKKEENLVESHEVETLLQPIRTFWAEKPQNCVLPISRNLTKISFNILGSCFCTFLITKTQEDKESVYCNTGPVDFSKRGSTCPDFLKIFLKIFCRITTCCFVQERSLPPLFLTSQHFFPSSTHHKTTILS